MRSEKASLSQIFWRACVAFFSCLKWLFWFSIFKLTRYERHLINLRTSFRKSKLEMSQVACILQCRTAERTTVENNRADLLTKLIFCTKREILKRKVPLFLHFLLFLNFILAKRSCIVTAQWRLKSRDSLISKTVRSICTRNPFAAGCCFRCGWIRNHRGDPYVRDDRIVNQ